MEQKERPKLIEVAKDFATYTKGQIFKKCSDQNHYESLYLYGRKDYIHFDIIDASPDVFITARYEERLKKLADSFALPIEKFIDVFEKINKLVYVNSDTVMLLENCVMEQQLD